MIDGKAKLIRDDYCDGLGNCLPACPADAISFEEREAAAYDHEAVLAHMAARKAASLMPTEAPAPKPEFTGCPGSMSRTISHAAASENSVAAIPGHSAPVSMESRLSQWPVQIKLAPVRARTLTVQSFLSRQTVPLTHTETSTTISLMAT